MISVIIPLYNKERSIDKTIESVLNQTYTDFELIVIDDGSTDGSSKIVKSFEDDRIYLIYKENAGVSSARNFGINEVKGDWVLFLDADDIIESKCLENLYMLTEKYPNAVIATCNYQEKNIKRNRTIEKCFQKKMGLIKNPFKAIWLHKIEPRTGNTIIKKDLIIQAGYYNTNIQIYEDMDYILRFCKDAEIAYTPEVLFNYIISNSELSIIEKPLNKTYSYYIDLKEGGFYEKLIKSEIIYIQLRKYISLGNKKDFTYLLNKNKFSLLIIIVAALYRKILK